MFSARIEALAGNFILLSGWRRSLWAFFAGSVSALSTPPFDQVWVLFLTFPILVWLMDNVSSEAAIGWLHKFCLAFIPGFFFGFGYFLFSLWWLGNAMLVDAQNFAWAIPFAVLALPAFLACFWGVATSVAGMFWAAGTTRLFMLAGCFSLAEYARGHLATGFPWNAIGYAAYPVPVLMQSASVLGIYGITAFAVFVFSIFGLIVPGGSRKLAGQRFTIFLAISFLSAHVAFGFWRMPSEPVVTVENVTLRLVQPAIDQKDKWDPAQEAGIFKQYLDLSTRANSEGYAGLSEVSHLIWPESAFPFVLTERQDALGAISAMLPENTSLITGAIRVETAAVGQSEVYVFNSVYAIGPGGEIEAAADKVHLVPFGEYLPFREALESIGLQQLAGDRGGFAPGNSRKLVTSGIAPQFLPLICYEVIFSGNLMDGNQRAGWIVNLTNDGWFGSTPGPYQHLRQAILRAVEEGLPLVRAANSGISLVVDPYGRVVKELSLGKSGILDSKLPKALGPTVFSQYGNSIFWIVTALFFAIGLFPLRKS